MQRVDNILIVHDSRAYEQITTLKNEKNVNIN